MKRPVKWSNEVGLTVTPQSYNMRWVHRFICRSIEYKNEIKIIKIKQDLLKLTKHSGMAIYDEYKIYIAQDVELDIKYIALFHEIFHYYFKDYDGSAVEQRAENSARNVLKWYRDNEREFTEFKQLFERIEVDFITDEELDLL